MHTDGKGRSRAGIERKRKSWTGGRNQNSVEERLSDGKGNENGSKDSVWGKT